METKKGGDYSKNLVADQQQSLERTQVSLWSVVIYHKAKLPPHSDYIMAAPAVLIWNWGLIALVLNR